MSFSVILPLLFSCLILLSASVISLLFMSLTTLPLIVTSPLSLIDPKLPINTLSSSDRLGKKDILSLITSILDNLLPLSITSSIDIPVALANSRALLKSNGLTSNEFFSLLNETNCFVASNREFVNPSISFVGINIKSIALPNRPKSPPNTFNCAAISTAPSISNNFSADACAVDRLNPIDDAFAAILVNPCIPLSNPNVFIIFKFSAA